MIKIFDENLIPIRDVPKHLPPRPSGRRVHISAVYRWMSRGVRGRRLESIKIGGSTYTSKEALERFANHLSDRSCRSPQSKLLPKVRQKQIERAAGEVNTILKSCRTGRKNTQI